MTSDWQLAIRNRKQMISKVLIQFDLSPNPSPRRRGALNLSYSPSLVGKGLGVRSFLRCLLQIRPLFRHDRPLHGTNLQTNPTINAGREIDPIPITAFRVFTRAFVNTGHWASIYTIGNAFTSICNNRMWHSVLSLKNAKQINLIASSKL